MKKIGLALGGGGARGLCHIAFIKALDEMGVKPSVIAGTSIGAIIGGFYASGMTGVQMEKMIDKIGFIDIGRMMDLSVSSTSALLKGKGVEDFLRDKLPVKLFDNLKIPLKIVATDYWNKKEVIIESGNLIKGIRASMSLPAVFEPIKIDNEVLIDGGAVNPLPYDIIRKDCDLLIAIDVSGRRFPSKHTRIPAMLESILSTFEIMQASIVDNKMRISQPDIYVKPLLKNVQLLEFYRYRHIISSVRDDVVKFEREVGKALEKKPKRSSLFRFLSWR
jgi:NTE family protein